LRTYRASIEGAPEPLEGLTVYLEEVTDPSGLRSWYGVFQLGIGESIGMGAGPFRLNLEDGRSGDILIRNLTISSGAPTQVSFVGSGPLAPS
jgi:hypothetical protein